VGAVQPSLTRVGLPIPDFGVAAPSLRWLQAVTIET